MLQYIRQMEDNMSSIIIKPSLWYFLKTGKSSLLGAVTL